MKRHFHLPRVEGQASRQAHADVPGGTYEREIGREGFFGPATHLHHRHPPTGWTRFEGPLRPRAFDCTALATSRPSPWQAAELAWNAAVRLRFWRLDAAMPALARNADGDELLFVHEGAGRLFCDYGHLEITSGDYLVIPRGSMWRIEPSTPIAALLVEATGSSFQLPDRGLLGPHALFDPALLDTPRIDAAFLAQQDETRPWRVEVKRRNALSVITYPFNPLDAVGWHGDLSVLRLNLRDIRPVTSHRYHLPPSAHSTFVAERFVVCSFVPRPFETDPGAMKLPFFHSNDDFDEWIFYHRGSFFSRDDIHPGMATLHPAGFTHGPHPKALRNMFSTPQPATDEYAVMIDTRDPLEIGPAAAAIERGDYVDSWRTPP